MLERLTKLETPAFDMTEKIFLATGNRGKIQEMRPLFEYRDLELIQVKADVPEIDAKDVETVAEQKLLDSREKALEKGEVEESDILMVEDTGFYVESLDGFPGAEAAFFAGTAGAEKLLNLLENETDRLAYFKTAIAAWIDGEVKIFSGRMQGKVPERKRGESHPHLPYNSFFVPEGEEESLAENSMVTDESFHRTKAVEEFLDWYTG
jgi:XTP/dITP diphosphohydrolase